MEDETLYKLPVMELAHHRFLLKLGDRCPDRDVHLAALLKGLQDRGLRPLLHVPTLF